MSRLSGSVLIVGGGIAGVQAALDLAESGFYVHLVERSPAIGGVMSQLDKTFPTNDCSACILSPKLVECGRHLNINLLTLSELTGLDGTPGNFTATVVQQPRYVDPQKCIACGRCAEVCPKKVDAGFNFGMNKRKAAYLQYPQAVPLKFVLDPKACIYLNKPGRCGFCAKECPADAINFADKARTYQLHVGSVILSPGFKPFDPQHLDFTGYGRLANVVTSMEFERLLSPSGPSMGHLKRPSDGTEPRRIAWLQCVGSRDINRACHGYCSSVCCMYAIKQAVIAREHAEDDLSASIFFMDMRTHGKEFEKYYQRARESGVAFLRARIHSVLMAENGDLRLHWADEQGQTHDQEFDMVVLSVGLEMDPQTVALAGKLGIELDRDNFIATDSFSPVATSRPGVYVCGAAVEPKDIPQSVMEASGAALEVQRDLTPARWTETKQPQYPEERNVFAEPPRIGVFVCSCGINIASVVDVAAVTEYAATLPGVVYSHNNLFSCSQDTINQMAATIREQRLNRVVVASCSPRTHEPLFQETLRDAGINKYLFEMANIRDQDSWVHQDQPGVATEKAKDLVRMAVARVMYKQPLPYNRVAVKKSALVVGAGVAGMTAALSLADQGFPVTLVEREERPGGQATSLYRTWQGAPVRPYLENLCKRIENHPDITLKTGTEVVDASGSVGQFRTTLSDTSELEHGVTLLALGGEPYHPREYLYGQHHGVHTLLEMDRMIMEEPERIQGVDQAVFIHCVGSRGPDRPYCSRVCCTHAIDLALKFKELQPDMDIFMLYRDIRTYGRRERLYQEARAAGIVFVRYDLEHLPVVSDDNGALQINVHDPILERSLRLHPDLLVLATAVLPHPETSEVSRLYKCAVNEDGFLLEAHMKLRPVDFATDGIYLAGLCHYPKSLEESIVQAKAAAARAVRVLSHDAVPAESLTAEVLTSKCVGCGVCVQVCPYAAVSLGDETGRAEVNTALCKGCGACVAGCRSGAIGLKNGGDEPLMAAVEAALSH
ncbi:FAD-dependent oxidoreductase [Desulfolithobacter sp.]